MKIPDPTDSARFIYVKDVEESEICRTVIETRMPRGGAGYRTANLQTESTTRADA